LAENAIRSLLTLEGQSGPFIQSELDRLNGELNTLNAAIVEIENTTPTGPTSNPQLADVSNALQRLDPIWELLIPDEQRRVLELLIEKITVGKSEVKVQFRTEGIASIVDELSPIGTTEAEPKPKRAKQK
jgi:hypothetical protein